MDFTLNIPKSKMTGDNFKALQSYLRDDDILITWDELFELVPEAKNVNWGKLTCGAKKNLGLGVSQ